MGCTHLTLYDNELVMESGLKKMGTGPFFCKKEDIFNLWTEEQKKCNRKWGLAPIAYPAFLLTCKGQMLKI